MLFYDEWHLKYVLYINAWIVLRFICFGVYGVTCHTKLVDDAYETSHPTGNTYVDDVVVYHTFYNSTMEWNRIN